MAAIEKVKTVDQLLNADLGSLTTEELTRRKALIDVMASERNLDIVAAANQKFLDEKETRAKSAAAKTAAIKAEQEDNERIRKMCRHNTGGRDRQGFFLGDGEIYGRSVSKQQLPTGEIYGLCFRCQREWHRPSKRKVITGEITLAQYAQENREFDEMMSWKTTAFNTSTGELAGGQMFLVPTLMKQKQKDDEDFDKFLAGLSQAELLAAGVVRALAV